MKTKMVWFVFLPLVLMTSIVFATHNLSPVSPAPLSITTPTATPRPTYTPTPTATLTPTMTPTSTPKPTPTPTFTPTSVFSPDYSSDSLGKDLGIFIVTAYSGSPEEGGNITRCGVPVRPGVVAVDPEVIPLGSVIEIEGYGIGIALDTGGAIVGKRLDVFFPTREQALQWGVRKAQVRILELGAGC